MFSTHVKFFIRVFLKDKVFSLLNILGLALGIAVSIMLLLILQYDLNYDKHYANYERIYRVGGHLKATGVEVRTARSSRELGDVLVEEFPEVQALTRANNWDHVLVTYQRNGDDVTYYEEDVVRTDSTYFDVFKHKFLTGDEKTCLDMLNTIVLTESTAKKYFGDEPAIDKTLMIDGQAWKVTAVIEDLPANTHLKFDILLSGLARKRGWTLEQNGMVTSEAFWNPDVFVYVLMPENYNPENFYAKFPTIFDKYYKSFGDKVGGTYSAILNPLADIHFHSDLESDEPLGNMAYLYAFTAIGIFIVMLACINYMNLSTAKSTKRATEIAMKKTLGSGKRALIFSFLGEAVFLSFLSLVVAILIVQIVVNLSSFTELLGRDLSANFVKNPTLVVGAVGIALGIGLLSGMYPAFYLPTIPTITAMKGGFKNSLASHILRKVLITSQFAISIFVVVCTLFMRDQIDYLRNQDMGFDKENVLVLPIQDTLVQNQITSIKNELLQNPHVMSATTSYNVMGMGVGSPVMWAEGKSGMQQQAFAMIAVGEDFFKTMDISILKGRDFQAGPDTDIDNVFMCNEAAAKLMNWGDDAIGKKVKWFHAKTDGAIIAVVKDFNFRSLHNAIEPLLIVKSRKEGGFLHLRVSGENLPATLDYVKQKWAGYDPNHPFEYFFLDQRFGEQYKQDEVQYQLLAYLSYICIFISLLGLLGLSAFTAAQRTKEIGIRKVHGASVPRIIYLLYKDIMYLVIVAAVLVIAPAYYIVDLWMSNFAYQMPFNHFIFLLVALMALAFAFITVAFHSLKTARTNPVEALKYE